MKLLMIEWVDSNFISGWQHRNHFENASPSKCVTVGIGYEKKEYYNIALNISEINVGDIISIPKRSISKVTKLKVKKT